MTVIESLVNLTFKKIIIMLLYGVRPSEIIRIEKYKDYLVTILKTLSLMHIYALGYISITVYKKIKNV